MASSALSFDLTTAWLDQPSFVAYGLVRGAGNLVLQQQLTDNSTLAFYVLGEGPWDSMVRLWINRKAVSLPSSEAHFHPGIDGEIGNGMSATSTGGDQHVDSFWSSVPTLSSLTYSRYAWLALKVPPDPGAPSASLEVLADYQAMRCRIFDASGNQTAFQWTQNPAWWICDRIIRRFVLREAKVNQPLVTAELARFDWQSFSDAAAYYDADIGGGIKRFSDGGVVFLDGSLTEDRVLEQLLLMCRSYLLERNGKIALYADKARSSVFTFSTDNVKEQTFLVRKSNLRNGKNRISASFREISRATGSSDDATRFSISTYKLDHEAHQRAIGVRGPGLSVIPKPLDLQLDYGNNTAERVARLVQYQLVRQLGNDVDSNTAYNAPFEAEWTAFEDSLAVEPGDVITIDKSLSEEFGGRDYEVLEIEEHPDGTRLVTALEYVADAFVDVAPVTQGAEAPTPGTGLSSPLSLDGSNNLVLSLGKTIDDAGTSRFAVLAVDGNRRAIIDLSQAGHLNKNQDNVPDGTTRFARTAAHSSFRPTSNPIVGHDAGGGLATISVSASAMRVGGTDVNLNSGPVSGLPNKTLHYVYYDDASLAGGGVTYNAVTTKETALAGNGRFFLGSVATPASGGSDTVGNNDGGTGAQIGIPFICNPSQFSGNFTSASNTGGSASSVSGSVSETWSSFLTAIGSGITSNKVLSVTSSFTISAGIWNAVLQYSLDGGSSWTVIYNTSVNRAQTTDTVSLPSGQDLSLVQVQAQVNLSSGTSPRATMTVSQIKITHSM